MTFFAQLRELFRLLLAELPRPDPPQKRWDHGFLVAIAERVLPGHLPVRERDLPLRTDPHFRAGYEWGSACPLHWRVPEVPYAEQLRRQELHKL